MSQGGINTMSTIKPERAVMLILTCIVCVSDFHLTPLPLQKSFFKTPPVVIPSHDPNVIFSLANNRTSVIVFY
jgi:hypothetical protein